MIRTFKKGITNDLEILACIGNSKYFERKIVKTFNEGRRNKIRKTHIFGFLYSLNTVQIHFFLT